MHFRVFKNPKEERNEKGLISRGLSGRAASLKGPLVGRFINGFVVLYLHWFYESQKNS